MSNPPPQVLPGSPHHLGQTGEEEERLLATVQLRRASLVPEEVRRQSTAPQGRRGSGLPKLSPFSRRRPSVQCVALLATQQ